MPPVPAVAAAGLKLDELMLMMVQDAIFLGKTRKRSSQEEEDHILLTLRTQS